MFERPWHYLDPRRWLALLVIAAIAMAWMGNLKGARQAEILAWALIGACVLAVVAVVLLVLQHVRIAIV